MFVEAIEYILQTLLGLFTIAALLRFYLQLTGAPFQNPFSQSMMALTNFIVKPLRKVIPGWRGMDISSLLTAYLTQLLLTIAVSFLHGFPWVIAFAHVWLVVLGLALTAVLKLSIYIFVYAVVIQAILSWVNPYNMMTPLLDALTRPILTPIRKRLPIIAGGFDLSPLVVFMVAQLIIMLLINPMEAQLLHRF